MHEAAVPTRAQRIERVVLAPFAAMGAIDTVRGARATRAAMELAKFASLLLVVRAIGEDHPALTVAAVAVFILNERFEPGWTNGNPGTWFYFDLGTYKPRQAAIVTATATATAPAVTGAAVATGRTELALAIAVFFAVSMAAKVAGRRFATIHGEQRNEVDIDDDGHRWSGRDQEAIDRIVAAYPPDPTN